MATFTSASPSPLTHPTEQLTGAVERVTFHSEETGFCVLRVKVRGHRDLVTVVVTAATITPGEYLEGPGVSGLLIGRMGVSARRKRSTARGVGVWRLSCEAIAGASLYKPLCQQQPFSVK